MDTSKNPVYENFLVSKILEINHLQKNKILLYGVFREALMTCS